jgi:hypothetical protein
MEQRQVPVPVAGNVNFHLVLFAITQLNLQLKGKHQVMHLAYLAEVTVFHLYQPDITTLPTITLSHNNIQLTTQFLTNT